MDKLMAMEAFVEIAERGSLTAAAEALGKAQPTMVRTLANLEAALGVRLVRRTTRRLSLTEEGAAYLERCRQILADVTEAEQTLVAGGSEPKGLLRVTAPVTFGQWHVAPAVFAFLRRYQAVQVDLLLLDRVVNLLEEGIDLAVRIGPLPDSSMVGIPVGAMRQVVVASPALLASNGHPSLPSDLADCPAVSFSGTVGRGVWRFGEPGAEVSVRLESAFQTNQAIAAVSACEEGIGFGRFLAYQVAPAVAAGRLEVVLGEFEPPPLPVSLMYTEARLMTPRLRALVDHMREALRKALLDLTLAAPE